MSQKKANKRHKLNKRQQDFIIYYLETGNGAESARRAGYSEKTARSAAKQLMTNNYITEEINRLRKEQLKKNIATAEDVMDFFTRAMNGEIKDQFGLEATLSDRIKAGQELAKRTVDIENKIMGKEDTTVHIKLDWD